jgi:type IV pilus assembly protein PilO
MRFGLREIVFVLLLLGIPVGAWWFAFKPHNAQNTAMLKEIEEKRVRLRALNQATGTIGDLKQEIASLDDAVKFFQTKLPNEKEIDKVLQEVWQLAEQNHLITKSIRTLDRRPGDGAPQDGNYAEQPVGMKLQGDFKGFYAFLLAIENQPRIMRISQMKIGKEEKGGPGAIQVDLVMSVFFEGAKDSTCISKTL